MPAEAERVRAGESPVPRALTAQDDRTAYKSPQSKVVKSFAQSREQWKEKWREAKASRKPLKKKLQGVEARQRRQKHRVHALESAVARLQAENRGLEEAMEAGEKKAR